MLPLDQILARVEKATRGPWKAQEDFPYAISTADGLPIGEFYGKAAFAKNVDFVIHARTDVPALCREVEELRAENKRCEDAYIKTHDEVCQSLGKALGYYPWYKDDPKNFPSATEADGVCVGEHVAESIAEEAAAQIISLRTALKAAVEAMEYVGNHFIGVDCAEDECRVLDSATTQAKAVLHD